MARSVGRGAVADARRLAGALSIRADDARPRHEARSHAVLALAPFLGTTTQTRTMGSHPSDCPQWIECSPGIRNARSAHPGCAVARNVRLQGYAPSCQRKDSGHAASPVTSATARPNHQRPLQLLEVGLPRSEKRASWPLSQTFMARRSPHGPTDSQSQTAVWLIWFIWSIWFIWLDPFNQTNETNQITIL